MLLAVEDKVKVVHMFSLLLLYAENKCSGHPTHLLHFKITVDRRSVSSAARLTAGL
jgi:hypothetical protein